MGRPTRTDRPRRRGSLAWWLLVMFGAGIVAATIAAFVLGGVIAGLIVLGSGIVLLTATGLLIDILGRPPRNPV